MLLKQHIRIVIKVILVIVAMFSLYFSFHFFTELLHNDFHNHVFNPNISLLKLQEKDLDFRSGLTEIYRQSLNGLVFYTCILLSCVLCFVFLRFRSTTNFLWTTSWTLAVAFNIGTFLICWITLRYASNHDLDMLISDTEELTDFQQNHTYISSQNNKREPPIFIKTGLFIQSLQFNTANDVVITCYIWQKYDHKNDSLQFKLDTGFVLPEATEINITQAYRKDYEDFTVYGWDVETTIRETFNYTNYPFDFQNVWVRMWHKNFDRNVILIPDFEAYKNIDSKAKMGIEEHIVLNGWDITETFFGYRNHNYNSNFGMPDYVGLEKFPELHYCILVQRYFLTTFISELLPILTILFILFVCAGIAHDEAKDDFFRFNVMELLSLVAAMVFVIILLQIDIRRKFSSSEILYIEYFYFMLYFVIFGVLFNYILLNQFKHLKIIQYEDNILIKVSMLPVSFGYILYVTYLIFSY
jgi:hypothetical protein